MLTVHAMEVRWVAHTTTVNIITIINVVVITTIASLGHRRPTIMTTTDAQKLAGCDDHHHGCLMTYMNCHLYS